MRRGFDTFCGCSAPAGNSASNRSTWTWRPRHAVSGRRRAVRVDGAGHQPSFTAALRHIDAVLLGREQPRCP
jgi:hypothetical protein